MKLRSILLSAACALALTATFTSCSDDDDDDSWKKGAVVELNDTRAFLLNEGKWGSNNASLIYFDYTTNTVTNTSCIFTQQNGYTLGDVGNDIIAHKGKVFIAVYNSNYITMLNGSGVELARLSFEDTGLGQVRDIAADGNYLYVSSYNGFLSKVRFTNDSLYIVKSVEVGSRPESVAICYGNVYTALGVKSVDLNYKYTYDSRVAMVKLSDFEKDNAEVSYIDVMVNPDNLVAEDGHLYVEGYGEYDAYWNCDYPWGEISKDGTYTEIGNAHVISGGDDKVYTALSKTDWTVGTTVTTLTVYDVENGTSDTSYFKNVPSVLATSSIYSISVNPYTDYVYVTTSSYSADGYVYVFDDNGNYVTSFSSYGINPTGIAFLKN